MRRRRTSNFRNRFISGFATLLLVSLIGCSIFLTVRVWNSKELWSYDYNFFSGFEGVRNFFGRFRTAQELEGEGSTQALVRPSNLVLSDGLVRGWISEGDSGFERLSGMAENAAKAVLSGGAQSEGTDFGLISYEENITEAEFLSMFIREGLQSLYFKLPCRISLETLALSYGVSNGVDKKYIEHVEHIVVFYPYGAAQATVIFADFGSGSFVRFGGKTLGQDFVAEVGRYDGLKRVRLGGIDADGEKLQIIRDFPGDTPRVSEINPVKTGEDGMVGESTAYAVLEQFSYNKSGIRRYVEKDNTVVFADNHSSLRISPQGWVEYKTVIPERGVLLENTAGVRDERMEYAMINGVHSIVRSVWKSFLWNRHLNIKLTGISPGYQKGTQQTLYFDYVSQGDLTMVAHGDNGEAYEHAVSAVVKDGRLVSLKFYIRAFDEAED